MAEQSKPVLPPISDAEDVDAAWHLILAAARAADRLEQANEPATFAPGPGASLRSVASNDPKAILTWRPAAGWHALVPEDDGRRPLMDLYLPICSATAARPLTVGHLGQSLDGFIATHAGDSQWVTGPENMRHMHRLRALCDAVIVGAGTIAADDPQLTTRLVTGPNPLRVILDPARRLADDHRVFTDDAVETVYACAQSQVRRAESFFGRASVVGVEDEAGGLSLSRLMQMLRERGCARVFVEGGGVTVSMFLEANLLDRLHVTVAPLFIGDGRPAIRLAPRPALRDCERPRYRVFRMGGDVLFDCELGTRGDHQKNVEGDTRMPVARVI